MTVREQRRVAGRKIAALVLLELWLLAGCAKQSENGLQLPSGERVTIVNAHGDYVSNVSGVKHHIYYVSYETSHDINDLETLRMEAIRVWVTYEPQIAGTDYDLCVITPMKKTSGAGEEGHPFYFVKNATGAWALRKP